MKIHEVISDIDRELLCIVITSADFAQTCTPCINKISIGGNSQVIFGNLLRGGGGVGPGVKIPLNCLELILGV